MPAMLTDMESIIVCIISIIFGSCLCLASWINMVGGATGGYAKVLAVVFFVGIAMCLIAGFSLIYGDIWTEIAKQERF